jgi:hypothetical protein
MPAFTTATAFVKGVRNRHAFRLTLTGCDKRALVPHPTRAIFLTNVSFHGCNLGVIGGLGVNGPHCALAAKRFHPVTLSTAAHFLNTAHNPSSLLFSPQNTHIRPSPNYTQNTYNYFLQRKPISALSPITQQSRATAQNDNSESSRSPTQVLTSWFFPKLFTCLISSLLCYGSMCCENHVFLSSHCFLYFAATLAAQAIRIPYGCHRNHSMETSASLWIHKGHLFFSCSSIDCLVAPCFQYQHALLGRMIALPMWRL